MVKSIYAQLGIFYVIFSLIFGLIKIISGAKIEPNDFIRVVILIVYFSWTSNLYTNTKRINKFLYILCMVSLLLLISEFLLQYKYPEIMQSVLNPEYLRNENRIYGTIGNANTFAIYLVANMAIIWLLKRNNLNRLIVYTLLIIIVVIVNYSGSRTGMIAWFILTIYIFCTQYKESHLKIFYIFGAICISLIVMLGLKYHISKTENIISDEYETVLKRLWADKSSIDAANKSSQIRINSIKNAIKYSYQNYLCLWGPGMLAFQPEWEEKVGKEYPHMGIFLLLCQYGFLSIFPMFIILRLFNVSLKANMTLLYYIYIINFMNGATTMYYFLAFLLVFTIQFIQKSLKDVTCKRGIIACISSNYMK